MIIRELIRTRLHEGARRGFVWAGARFLILIDGLISFSKGIIGIKFLLDKQFKHKLQSKLSRLKYLYLHHSSTN